MVQPFAKTTSQSTRKHGMRKSIYDKQFYAVYTQNY